MKATISKTTTRRDLAGIVVTALAAEGIEAILVGGAVVSLYAEGRYVTDDLDLVTYRPLKRIQPVMEQLGFAMTGNRATHPDTDLYIQFCAPPLAVGRRAVETVTVNTPSGPIQTLSPTDCVLDRLMKFYHWDDEQSLEQALLVARKRKIDLDQIETASKAEGKEEQFAIFEARLTKRRVRST